MKDTSPSGTLSKQDWKAWVTDSIYFSLGLFGIYSGAVASQIKDPITIKAFIPNAVVVGAILYYITNVIQNLIRKRNNGI